MSVQSSAHSGTALGCVDSDAVNLPALWEVLTGGEDGNRLFLDCKEGGETLRVRHVLKQRLFNAEPLRQAAQDAIAVPRSWY